jgi:hypothetical protein
MPVFLRDNIGSMVADFPFSYFYVSELGGNALRRIGQDMLPTLSYPLSTNIRDTKFKRCSCPLIRAGSANSFADSYPDANRSFSTSFAVNINYATESYANNNFSPPQFMQNDRFINEITPIKNESYQFLMSGSILSHNYSCVAQNFKYYGFQCVLLNSPISFRASNSYNITNGAISSLSPSAFDIYYSQSQSRSSIGSLSLSAISSATDNATSNLSVSVSEAFSDKLVEFKLLNYADYLLCISENSNAWDLDFYNDLESPTIDEAVALGGCQYWGIIQHVKPFRSSFSINVTASKTSITEDPVVPFGNSTCSYQRSYSEDRDFATINNSVDEENRMGSFLYRNVSSALQKSGVIYLPYYSATPGVTPDLGLPVNNISICLLP